MAAKGQNAGIRVLEEFDCQAILNPSVPQGTRTQQGRNEAVCVIDELIVETADTRETTKHLGSD